MEKNEIFDIDISSITSHGDGVGRADEMVVFVPGSVPGDIVKIEITQRRKNHARGRIIKLLSPSPDRIEPPCNKAYKCGGCSMQFMNYDAQLKWKRSSVREAFVRIGKFKEKKIDNVMEDIIPSAKTSGYRNKVLLPVDGKNDAPEIGYYIAGTHEIVDTDICMVNPPFADKVRELFRGEIISGNISPFDQKTGKGNLRHIMVRTGTNTDQVMVAAVLKNMDARALEGLKKKLINLAEKEGKELTAFYANINPDDTNTVLGKESILLYGKGYIEEKILGLTYRISPTAFFQVNTPTAAKLFEKVLEFASLDKTERAMDLYCGTGSITLLLAQRCAHVTGIEIVSEAILDARENAKNNNISNVDFYAGKSEDILPELVNKGDKTDVIVLDPPRKGAERAVLDAILKVSPERIAYVSCDPATLARDCKILCENNGYIISKTSPVDLFPWTGHVETVVLMSRVKE